MPAMTVNERRNQYTSKSRTASATTSAPSDANRSGIHAGARSRTHVTRPGAASRRRSPAWRRGEGAGGTSVWGAAEDTSRRFKHRGVGGLRRHGIPGCPDPLFKRMSNLKKFEEATFDEEVLQAAGPVLVDFYSDQ